MKMIRWTGGVNRVGLLMALVLGSLAGAQQLRAGTSPGASFLAPCPASPNCVSSQATTAGQRVDPLRYSGDEARARARLMAVLNHMERVRTTHDADGTVHAEFRSALFGFVDEVAFRFDPPGQIQVRSASQSGYYDFGVNRRRVEMIRTLFAEAGEAAP
ncbi:MAG: DUF1499 domain-containing protein [Azoarcus sp.]|nr:DUF1499 domain-containing protein [Azoarcus sp.]